MSDVELARSRVTEARTLFGIDVELMPQTKHVTDPTVVLQESDLPAAPDPGAKDTYVKSVVE